MWRLRPAHRRRWDRPSGDPLAHWGYADPVKTHGQSYTALYQAWQNMKKRTTPGSSQQRNWPEYVGVSRDTRWDTFEPFAQDMGGSYFPGAVLGRYGDQGDYTPTNCRWISKSESGRESASPRLLRLPDGRIARDVARANGVGQKTFESRRGAGWSVERAATTPPRQRGVAEKSESG